LIINKVIVQNVNEEGP